MLCAGVVQDPLLLWRSGIGPAEAVRHLGITPVLDRSAVGSHLTDHLVITFTAPVAEDVVAAGSPSIQTILRATSTGPHRPRARPPADPLRGPPG